MPAFQNSIFGQTTMSAGRLSLKLISKLWNFINPDRRPDCEKAREQNFITAANKFKTLSVNAGGVISIDPEEIRDQIITSREQLKHLVHKPGTHGWPSAIQGSHDSGSTGGTPVNVLDCIDVVAWRRLASGEAVRYACLQSIKTGEYTVMTASLFSGDMDSLPPWFDADTNRKIATALRGHELQWFHTLIGAMDAWDAEL